MAQASLKSFVPDLPPSGRIIRQRTLAAGDPSTSRIVEARLGARPDRWDFEPARCLAKRKGIGDQCGRFPASGRVVCIVHGAGSARRQREGGALPPEVSGAIGSAIRDVRLGRRKLDDLAAFFQELQERLEAYRREPERLDLREDALHLTALRELLLSGAIPASVAYVMRIIPRLSAARTRVLKARHTIEARHSVPIERVDQLVREMIGIMQRNIPPDLHALVARELRMLGANSIPCSSGR